MDVMSTARRFRNPKRRSDRGDHVLHVQRRVRWNEYVPRFGGSTEEFLAIKGEVRAEDVESEPALPLRAPHLGDPVNLLSVRNPFANRFEPRDVALVE